ncbi:MAG: Rrf2 family transcriptional regulator [Ignavibacteriaceae bacterium]|jgi:Rrf2 family protein|nr:Rrf2 family transcriptional regulator [Ignavibacteriaceae bacterium]
MSASTKLSSSVKALCYLANNSLSQNSNDIADATGINASKIRRLMALLGKAGIIKSDGGMLGGYALNKSSDQIHLQEIYCAIEDRKAFYLDVNKEKLNQSANSKKINKFFLDLFSDIQIEIETKMETITLKDILNHIK